MNDQGSVQAHTIAASRKFWRERISNAQSALLEAEEAFLDLLQQRTTLPVSGVLDHRIEPPDVRSQRTNLPGELAERGANQPLLSLVHKRILSLPTRWIKRKRDLAP